MRKSVSQIRVYLDVEFQVNRLDLLHQKRVLFLRMCKGIAIHHSI